MKNPKEAKQWLNQSMEPNAYFQTLKKMNMYRIKMISKAQNKNNSLNNGTKRIQDSMVCTQQQNQFKLSNSDIMY